MRKSCLLLILALLMALAASGLAEGIEAEPIEAGVPEIEAAPMEVPPEDGEADLWTAEMEEAEGAEEAPPEVAAPTDYWRIVNNLYFRIEDETEHTLAICGCLDTAETVWIPQSLSVDGVKWKVVTLLSNAFEDNAYLKTVVFEKPIGGEINLKGYGVGLSVCAGCTSLEKVVIPPEYRQLEGDPYWQSAFYTGWTDGDFDYETALEEETGLFGASVTGYHGPESVAVTIPSKTRGITVRFLGEEAFRAMAITGVTIPNTVRGIGARCFADTNITAAMIPSGVVRIGQYAFFNCPELKKADIPGTVESISQWAFNKCPKLEELHIGEGVKEIGTGAFSEAASLKSVEIPDSVEIIDSGAFNACPALETLHLGDGVEFIGISAFGGDAALTELKLGPKVEYIGEAAFGGAGIKGDLVIPDSVTHMAQGAFLKCASLETVTVGAGLSLVPKEAFKGCAALKTATLGSGVTKIGDSAFRDCAALEVLAIPATVTEIGEGWDGVNPKLFVLCDAGSYAETWAKAMGFACGSAVPPPETPETPETPVTPETPETPVTPETPETPETPAAPISIKSATITVKNATYTGKPAKPAVTVKLGGVKLVKGTDYIVKCSKKSIGKAIVAIQGIGKYTDTVKKSFKIVPKRVAALKVKAGKKQMAVAWKKVKGVTGYQIQYGLKKNFKGAKKVTLKKDKTVKKVIKNLKSGKKYYVRIRTYKKVNGKAYVSAWSKVKAVKVK